MAIPQCNAETNAVSNLPDSPAISPAELKATFDRAGNEIKTYINDQQNPGINSTINSAISGVNTTITNMQTTNNARFTNIENQITQLQGKITSGSVAPSGGSDGDIYIQYF